MSRVHHVLGLGCARALCRSGLIFVHWKTLVVPKAPVRNLQKGKLELIFQGFFFFRCQLLVFSGGASFWNLAQGEVSGRSCMWIGRPRFFASKPSRCLQRVGWLNQWVSRGSRDLFIPNKKRFVDFSHGVISKLKDGHASDQFMFLFINGRFVEQTPIHRQIANFYATSSLSDPSQGGAK